MYDNHEVYVRLSDGLLQPILTTIGLKQGCGISPLVFNLFMNKLPDVFNQTCDPAKLQNEKLTSLLWTYEWSEYILLNRYNINRLPGEVQEPCF